MSDKATRAEVIAALVTDKYSGFKTGDEAILEAASDARLEEFRANADAAKTSANNFARLESDNRNNAARLKVAEERLKEAEQPMTEEDFIAKAPEKIKKVLTDMQANEAAERGAIISQLKDCGADTEESLKKKSTDELRTLAKYARVEVPDFSGRGLPKERHASENQSFAPPSPYAEGLKALKSKAVN